MPLKEVLIVASVTQETLAKLFILKETKAYRTRKEKKKNSPNKLLTYFDQLLLLNASFLRHQLKHVLSTQ